MHVDREVAAQARVDRVVVAGTGRSDQRQELGLELVEDLPDLRSRHAPLVVVQQDVVGLFVRVEALDVAASKLDVLLERGRYAA